MLKAEENILLDTNRVPLLLPLPLVALEWHITEKGNGQLHERSSREYTTRRL